MHAQSLLILSRTGSRCGFSAHEGGCEIDTRDAVALSITACRALRLEPAAAMPLTAHLTLRPVRDEDEPFLRELRAHVDIERLHLNHWAADALPLAQKVIASQFNVHSAHYRKVKSRRDTKDCVIELNGRTVGRFIVTQDAEVVYLSDIAVHPNFRGQGIGEAVIESTKHECEQSKRLLHLHVDRDNRALQFYLQLGFRAIAQGELNLLMEWVPPSLVGRTQIFTPKATP